MSRELPEWIGKTDDSAIPDHVKLRVFTAHNGVCPKCTRKLRRGEWDCDHIVALVNGGPNRESNLQPLCKVPCHSQKTADDVAEKSKVYRKRKAHVLSKRRRTIPGRRFNGDPISSVWKEA